jgi:hypothetical protein
MRVGWPTIKRFSQPHASSANAKTPPSMRRSVRAADERTDGPMTGTDLIITGIVVWLLVVCLAFALARAATLGDQRDRERRLREAARRREDEAD